MNTQHTKKVIVFKGEKYAGDWPPVQAADCLAWFAAKIAEVPPEHLATAKVEFDSRTGYEDSSYASIEISYTRPETDEEIVVRKRNLRAQQKAQEIRERAQFEALKLKFER